LTICLIGGSINPVPPGFPAWDHEMDFNVQADMRDVVSVRVVAKHQRRFTVSEVD